MEKKIAGEKRKSAYRCSGGPEGPGEAGSTWGRLGGPSGTKVTEDTCKLLCLGRIECRFAVWKIDKKDKNVGSCSSFSTCDSVQEESKKKFTIWEKIRL
jgi:hypothetical protein